GLSARLAMSQFAFSSSQGKMATQYQIRMKNRFPKKPKGRSWTKKRAENHATRAETTAPAASSCQAKEPVKSIQNMQQSTKVARNAGNVVFLLFSKFTPPEDSVIPLP